MRFCTLAQGLTTHNIQQKYSSTARSDECFTEASQAKFGQGELDSKYCTRTRHRQMFTYTLLAFVGCQISCCPFSILPWQTVNSHRNKFPYKWLTYWSLGSATYGWLTEWSLGSKVPAYNKEICKTGRGFQKNTEVQMELWGVATRLHVLVVTLENVLLLNYWHYCIALYE